ncbi:MAG: permease [Spirochaetes bacterium]|nr:permease [Spirochaetota bacterium]
MKNFFKRYLVAIISVFLFIMFLLVFPSYRSKSISMIAFQTKTMFLLIPPIFILLGLLDIWVPREKMIKYMGKGSGLKGTVIAFLLGSFAAGPLYGAFPFAAVLMKKGASFKNILIFIGAWSTTKIPMLLFEIGALGLRFALSRFAIDIVGIIVIAKLIIQFVPQKEVDRVYGNAENLI